MSPFPAVSRAVSRRFPRLSYYLGQGPHNGVHFEGVQKGWLAMPRVAVDDNKRMNLRVTPLAKSKLVRAAALRHTDLTDFVTQTALREADAVIAAAEVVTLSERDSLLVLNLLEHPPAPNAKLRAAIAAMPKPKA